MQRAPVRRGPAVARQHRKPRIRHQYGPSFENTRFLNKLRSPPFNLIWQYLEWVGPDGRAGGSDHRAQAAERGGIAAVAQVTGEVIDRERGGAATYTELASASPEDTGKERQTARARANIPQPSRLRARARRAEILCLRE